MANGYNEVEHLDATFKAYQEKSRKILEQSYEKQIDDERNRLGEQLKKNLITQKEYDKQLADYRKKINEDIDTELSRTAFIDRKKALDAEAKYKKTLLKTSSAAERAEILKNSAESKRQLLLQYDFAKDRVKQLTQEFGDKSLMPESVAKEFEALNATLKNFDSSIEGANEQQKKENLAADARKDLLGSIDDILNDKGASKEKIKQAEEDANRLVKEDPTDKQARKKLADATQRRLQEEREEAKEKKNEDARERREQIKFRAQQLKTLLKFSEDSKAVLKDLANEGFDAMMKAVEQPISTFFEYQAKYEARLQGSQNHYDKMMTNINRQIGLSPFIKQQAMVKNLQDMIDKGINYNVELRAYLATVSEGIASTFDAFDSNLLRLIRIQQNDSTAARLGIEAALTKFFNNMYSDTSYLGQGGPADQVTAALLEASAQLTHQGAAEMEFVAQKWLGSLYSLGVSGEAVQNIAQGLGYLGSGNIGALSGNDTLMSLLAMSASRGGTSISEILTGGLTADTTNKLLQGMVGYLAEIANNTDSNNVTKSSIAQVFGLTNTDLRSVMNLNQNDIDKIFSTNINYGGALAETANQLTQVRSRTHISQMLTNVIENAKNGAALTIGGNPAMYGMAKILQLVGGLVGTGMDIPGLLAFGTGMSSSLNILDIAKAGILGSTLFSTLIGSIGSIAGGGLPSLSSWKGYEKALERGTGLNLQPKGVQSGFSESAQYNSKGSASTSDLGASSMQSAKETATENQSEEDKESGDLATKFYKEGLTELQEIHECIQKLTAENSALKVVITPDTSENSPFNKFKLSDITDAAAKKLSSAFRAVILGNFVDETMAAAGIVAPGDSLAQQIASAMNGVNVHIDNDWFDEANQNNALGGSRG